MKRLLKAMVALLLTGAAARAADPSQLLTRPTVPPAEALDRLNLKLAWRAHVPMDGARDGLFSVQMLGPQVLVQTRAGLIVLIDADTGQAQWQRFVGKPYRPTQAPGHNSKSIFAINGNTLYALDRRSGQIQWQYDLPFAAAAPPAADEEQLYLCLGIGRLYTYKLLRPEKPAAPGTTPDQGKKPEKPPATASTRPLAPYVASSTASSYVPLSTTIRELGSGTEPKPIFPLFDYRTRAQLELAPLVAPSNLLLADAKGRLTGVSKEAPVELWQFVADKPVLVPPAQHGELAYVASQDANLYALKIATGKLAWRFTTGEPLAGKPAVTDEDVYVVPQGAGLYCLDRARGDTVWRNRDAQRFLAVNPRFVYAADRNGRLLVLDRARGTQLSTYDGTRDFVYPVSNELTDRVFLAANDGLLVCLHDKQYAKPVPMKKEEGPPPPPGKPDDKPKDDDKDKPKDKGEMEKEKK